MMNTVEPAWDDNKPWPVLGGAGLLAAIPLAYAVVLNAFYLPLILMPLSRSLSGAQGIAPFVYTLVPVFRGHSGLGISLSPNIIPSAVSIHEAAAPL